MTATERHALELIKRLVEDLGAWGPVDQDEGDLWCLLCKADVGGLPVPDHAKSCLWLEILSNASEKDNS